MRVLIADDDAVLLHGLRVQLERWGYEPVACEDGEAARAVLRGPDPPPLAILDWSMPGADGITLCREIRSTPGLDGIYVILLTASDTRDEMVEGLVGGADEYITKPFDWGVLRARVKTGARIATLQQSLAQRVRELQCGPRHGQQALRTTADLFLLQAHPGTTSNHWQQLEVYLSEHSEAEFSHGSVPIASSVREAESRR